MIEFVPGGPISFWKKGRDALQFFWISSLLKYKKFRKFIEVYRKKKDKKSCTALRAATSFFFFFFLKKIPVQLCKANQKKKREDPLNIRAPLADRTKFLVKQYEEFCFIQIEGREIKNVVNACVYLQEQKK